MTNDISLRAVQPSDLPVFFAQQLDPDARRMAAFPARQHDAFMAHWTKILAEETNILRTVVFRGQVAGNIVAWPHADGWNVGYWLGKEFWGQGIATAALTQFLSHVPARPLFAHVARHNIASLRVLQKCGFTITGEATFDGPDGDQGEEFILTLAVGGRDQAGHG